MTLEQRATITPRLFALQAEFFALIAVAKDCQCIRILAALEMGKAPIDELICELSGKDDETPAKQVFPRSKVS